VTEPTTAQLLHLVDQAGRRRLAPAEHARLRDGVTTLAADTAAADEDVLSALTHADETCPVVQERDRLAARVAEYEAALGWETTCLGCSRATTAAYGETVRAEQAEAAVRRVRDLAADMRTWCSPHGIAIHYAERVEAALDTPPEPADTDPARPITQHWTQEAPRA